MEDAGRRQILLLLCRPSGSPILPYSHPHLTVWAKENSAASRLNLRAAHTCMASRDCCMGCIKQPASVAGNVTMGKDSVAGHEDLGSGSDNLPNRLESNPTIDLNSKI